MNIIHLLGRLTKEPEIKMSQKEMPIASFTLAVDRPYQKGKEKECDFINCIMFGKRAEVIGNYVDKGQRLLVTGSLRNNSFVGKDGTKKYYTNVIVNDFEFIEKGNKSAEKKTSMESFGKAEKDTTCFDEEVPF